MQPDAVIFDLDDTLFDHRGAADAAVVEWLRGLGADASNDLVGLWTEAEDRHVAAWNRGKRGFREQRRMRVAEMLAAIGSPPAREDAELDALFEDYLRRYETFWRAFDDVPTGLRAVEAAGLPYAILTNGADYQQRLKLEAVGLEALIERMHCCDVIGYSKPDPRSYRFVCDRLGAPYDRVLHVGDRHDFDVAGARAAGLQAVHLDRHGTGPEAGSGAIRSLAELAGLL